MTDEELAIQEVKAMSRDELDKVPFDVVHWRCKVRLCHCFTKARDYGAFPWFWHPRFGWLHRWENYFICSKHSKALKARYNSDLTRLPLRSYWGGDDTVKPQIFY